jgi:cytochrome c553
MLFRCPFLKSQEETIMKKMALTVAVSIALLPALAVAQPPAEKKATIEVRDYPGNTSASERDEALKLKGNVKAGQAAYQEYCEACHLPTGGGNPDGSIPQLAGQHSTVVIKQLADIRSGRRYNPTMYPFARKLANPQALANVAAYIQTLCIPLGSGRYAGPDAAEMLAGASCSTRSNAVNATSRTARVPRTSSTRCSLASTMAICCAR